MRPFRIAVNHPEDYRIAFTGLKPGIHQFDFRIGQKFFENVEDQEINDGDVSVTISVTKEERMMDFHFELHGKVIVPCDRCNDPVEMDISGNERLIVKLGDKYFEESEDVQIIPETDHYFDVAPFIYEFIHLSLPARRIHPEDANGNSLCNPDVLRKLEELTPEKGPDPRWEILRKLQQDEN